MLLIFHELVLLFNDLSSEIKIILTNHHQSQLNDNLTETQNISEWWQELMDDEYFIIVEHLLSNNSIKHNFSSKR